MLATALPRRAHATLVGTHAPSTRETFVLVAALIVLGLLL